MCCESSVVNIGCVISARGVSKNWGHKKTKHHARLGKSDILPICQEAELRWSLWILASEVHRLRHHPRQISWRWVLGFRSSGMPTPPIFPLFIGLAGRHYNSVSTTTLHCDIIYAVRRRAATNRPLLRLFPSALVGDLFSFASFPMLLTARSGVVAQR